MENRRNPFRSAAQTARATIGHWTPWTADQRPHCTPEAARRRAFFTPSIENTNVLVKNIDACLKDVKDWMYINTLKFYQDKNEIILCSPKNSHISINSIQCGDESICFGEFCKN